MRIAVEISDDHRDRLMKLAARRGERGISELTSEALRQYLSGLTESVRIRDEALALRGSLSTEEADALRRAIRDLRTAG